MRALLPTKILTSPTVSDPSLALGNHSRREMIVNKAKAWEAIKAGKPERDPSLYRGVGKKIGTAAGFKKYRGVNGQGWTWTRQNLDQYVTSPKKFVKVRRVRNPRCCGK